MILTNRPQNISSSGVRNSGLSHHELVYCERKLNWKRYAAQTKLLQNFANYDASKFCDKLKAVDWNSVIANDTHGSSYNVNPSCVD